MTPLSGRTAKKIETSKFHIFDCERFDHGVYAKKTLLRMTSFERTDYRES